MSIVKWSYRLWNGNRITECSTWNNRMIRIIFYFLLGKIELHYDVPRGTSKQLNFAVHFQGTGVKVPTECSTWNIKVNAWLVFHAVW